jgi:hypothetical protein
MSEPVRVHLVGGPMDGTRIVVPPHRTHYEIVRDPTLDPDWAVVGGSPRLVRGEYRAGRYEVDSDGCELWAFRGWR